MLKVLELFGGYGSQVLALENLGIEFESDLCEIDKYAIQAYNQLHGETFNWGDICSIDEKQLPYYDLITYSSPCQDFSVAGKQAGGDKGSGTRSSLLWECERIIRAVKPKYLLMENVKALTSKKFMPLFREWLRTLENMGYQNWWKVLNAKDYGVPQNRERVFVVSILGGGNYQFPEPIPLTKRLKDILEQNVDEKYYLSDKICERFHYKKVGQDIVGSTLGKECTRKGQRDVVYGTEHKIGALASTDYKQPKQILEPLACASRGRNPDNPSDRTAGTSLEQRLEINQNGTTNTITTVAKDNYVIVPEATKQGYAEAYEGDSINLEQPNSQTRRGRVGHQMANTLTCSCNQGVVEPKIVDDIYKNRDARLYDKTSPTLRSSHCGDLKVLDYRIRKLTPRECWRLMGVKDEQFDKLHDISNSQLYKMAGNSIVVDVLMSIFKNMFMPSEQEAEWRLL